MPASAVMMIRVHGGAIYSIEYRDFDGGKTRLSVQRRGGPGGSLKTHKPMVAGEWCRVSALTLLPPEIGSTISMALDPVNCGEDPVVRKSTMVMSPVGVL